MKSLSITGIAAIALILAACAPPEDEMTQQELAINTAQTHYEKNYGNVPGKPQFIEARRGRENNINITLQAEEGTPLQEVQTQAAEACDDEVLKEIEPLGLEIEIVDRQGSIGASAICK